MLHTSGSTHPAQGQIILTAKRKCLLKPASGPGSKLLRPGRVCRPAGAFGSRSGPSGQQASGHSSASAMGFELLVALATGFLGMQAARLADYSVVALPYPTLRQSSASTMCTPGPTPAPMGARVDPARSPNTNQQQGLVVGPSEAASVRPAASLGATSTAYTAALEQEFLLPSKAVPDSIQSVALANGGVAAQQATGEVAPAQALGYRASERLAFLRAVARAAHVIWRLTWTVAELPLHALDATILHDGVIVRGTPATTMVAQPYGNAAQTQSTGHANQMYQGVDQEAKTVQAARGQSPWPAARARAPGALQEAAQLAATSAAAAPTANLPQARRSTTTNTLPVLFAKSASPEAVAVNTAKGPVTGGPKGSHHKPEASSDNTLAWPSGTTRPAGPTAAMAAGSADNAVAGAAAHEDMHQGARRQGDAHSLSLGAPHQPQHHLHALAAPSLSISRGMLAAPAAAGAPAVSKPPAPEHGNTAMRQPSSTAGASVPLTATASSPTPSSVAVVTPDGQVITPTAAISCFALAVWMCTWGVVLLGRNAAKRIAKATGLHLGGKPIPTAEYFGSYGIPSLPMSVPYGIPSLPMSVPQNPCSAIPCLAHSSAALRVAPPAAAAAAAPPLAQPAVQPLPKHWCGTMAPAASPVAASDVSNMSVQPPTATDPPTTTVMVQKYLDLEPEPDFTLPAVGLPPIGPPFHFLNIKKASTTASRNPAVPTKAATTTAAELADVAKVGDVAQAGVMVEKYMDLEPEFTLPAVSLPPIGPPLAFGDLKRATRKPHQNAATPAAGPPAAAAATAASTLEQGLPENDSAPAVPFMVQRYIELEGSFYDNTLPPMGPPVGFMDVRRAKQQGPGKPAAATAVAADASAKEGPSSGLGAMQQEQGPAVHEEQLFMVDRYRELDGPFFAYGYPLIGPAPALSVTRRRDAATAARAAATGAAVEGKEDTEEGAKDTSGAGASTKDAGQGDQLMLQVLEDIEHTLRLMKDTCGSSDDNGIRQVMLLSGSTYDATSWARVREEVKDVTTADVLEAIAATDPSRLISSLAAAAKDREAKDRKAAKDREVADLLQLAGTPAVTPAAAAVPVSIATTEVGVDVKASAVAGFDAAVDVGSSLDYPLANGPKGYSKTAEPADAAPLVDAPEPPMVMSTTAATNAIASQQALVPDTPPPEGLAASQSSGAIATHVAAADPSLAAAAEAASVPNDKVSLALAAATLADACAAAAASAAQPGAETAPAGPACDLTDVTANAATGEVLVWDLDHTPQGAHCELAMPLAYPLAVPLALPLHMRPTGAKGRKAQAGTAGSGLKARAAAKGAAASSAAAKDTVKDAKAAPEATGCTGLMEDKPLVAAAAAPAAPEGPGAASSPSAAAADTAADTDGAAGDVAVSSRPLQVPGKVKRVSRSRTSPWRRVSAEARLAALSAPPSAPSPAPQQQQQQGPCTAPVLPKLLPPAGASTAHVGAVRAVGKPAVASMAGGDVAFNNSDGISKETTSVASGKDRLAFKDAQQETSSAAPSAATTTVAASEPFDPAKDTDRDTKDIVMDLEAVEEDKDGAKGGVEALALSEEGISVMAAAGRRRATRQPSTQVKTAAIDAINAALYPFPKAQQPDAVGDEGEDGPVSAAAAAAAFAAKANAAAKDGSTKYPAGPLTEVDLPSHLARRWRVHFSRAQLKAATRQSLMKSYLYDSAVVRGTNTPGDATKQGVAPAAAAAAAAEVLQSFTAAAAPQDKPPVPAAAEASAAAAPSAPSASTAPGSMDGTDAGRLIQDALLSSAVIPGELTWSNAHIVLDKPLGRLYQRRAWARALRQRFARLDSGEHVAIAVGTHRPPYLGPLLLPTATGTNTADAADGTAATECTTSCPLELHDGLPAGVTPSDVKFRVYQSAGQVGRTLSWRALASLRAGLLELKQELISRVSAQAQVQAQALGASSDPADTAVAAADMPATLLPAALLKPAAAAAAAVAMAPADVDVPPVVLPVEEPMQWDLERTVPLVEQAVQVLQDNDTAKDMDKDNKQVDSGVSFEAAVNVMAAAAVVLGPAVCGPAAALPSPTATGDAAAAGATTVPAEPTAPGAASVDIAADLAAAAVEAAGAASAALAADKHAVVAPSSPGSKGPRVLRTRVRAARSSLATVSRSGPGSCSSGNDSNDGSGVSTGSPDTTACADGKSGDNVLAANNILALPAGDVSVPSPAGSDYGGATALRSGDWQYYNGAYNGMPASVLPGTAEESTIAKRLQLFADRRPSKPGASDSNSTAVTAVASSTDLSPVAAAAAAPMATSDVLVIPMMARKGRQNWRRRVAGNTSNSSSKAQPAAAPATHAATATIAAAATPTTTTVTAAATAPAVASEAAPVKATEAVMVPEVEASKAVHAVQVTEPEQDTDREEVDLYSLWHKAMDAQVAEVQAELARRSEGTASPAAAAAAVEAAVTAVPAVEDTKLDAAKEAAAVEPTRNCRADPAAPAYGAGLSAEARAAAKRTWTALLAHSTITATPTAPSMVAFTPSEPAHDAPAPSSKTKNAPKAKAKAKGFKTEKNLKKATLTATTGTSLGPLLTSAVDVTKKVTSGSSSTNNKGKGAITEDQRPALRSWTMLAPQHAAPVVPASKQPRTVVPAQALPEASIVPPVSTTPAAANADSAPPPTTAVMRTRLAVLRELPIALRARDSSDDDELMTVSKGKQVAASASALVPAVVMAPGLLVPVNTPAAPAATSEPPATMLVAPPLSTTAAGLAVAPSAAIVATGSAALAAATAAPGAGLAVAGEAALAPAPADVREEPSAKLLPTTWIDTIDTIIDTDLNTAFAAAIDAAVLTTPVEAAAVATAVEVAAEVVAVAAEAVEVVAAAPQAALVAMTAAALDHHEQQLLHVLQEALEVAAGATVTAAAPIVPAAVHDNVAATEAADITAAADTTPVLTGSSAASTLGSGSSSMQWELIGSCKQLKQAVDDSAGNAPFGQDNNNNEVSHVNGGSLLTAGGLSFSGGNGSNSAGGYRSLAGVMDLGMTDYGKLLGQGLPFQALPIGNGTSSCKTAASSATPFPDELWWLGAASEYDEQDTDYSDDDDRDVVVLSAANGYESDGVGAEYGDTHVAYEEEEVQKASKDTTAAVEQEVLLPFADDSIVSVQHSDEQHARLPWVEEQQQQPQGSGSHSVRVAFGSGAGIAAALPTAPSAVAGGQQLQDDAYDDSYDDDDGFAYF